MNKKTFATCRRLYDSPALKVVTVNATSIFQMSGGKPEQIQEEDVETSFDY